MAETRNGRNKIIHIKINGERTTASIDITLADLLCLKLDNILSRENGATKLLNMWAQQKIAEYEMNNKQGISERLRYHALLDIADKRLVDKWRNEWMKIDESDY